MIGSLRNFAKTKFAGLLVVLMIIPFVFWGMGSMFSSGNTNNIAKINNTNISTQELIDHINRSNVPQKTIKENLDKNIIEDLLSTLISTTLLDLEIKDFNISISETTLLKKIKMNKDFLNDDGVFERTKYEKFLLENNESAPNFELKLRGRELQKNLFDYIGAGTKTPKFLAKKLYEEENKKIEIQLINLINFYKKKETFTDEDLKNFIDKNKEQLDIEYIDFTYAIINPKNLIGSDDFNQAFFDKIDEIEVKISNNLDIENLLKDYQIEPVKVSNFRNSGNKKDVENKIFESKNIDYDIIEFGDNFILYKINDVNVKSPDLEDNELKKELIDLVYQKNKFEYNRKLLQKINDQEFGNDDFLKMSDNKNENIVLNAINDDKRFDKNVIKILYSLPLDSFTLINDKDNNIYLTKIENIIIESLKPDDKKINEYLRLENSNNKKSILQTYDLLLNKKYNVVLNQKTIERVKNFFQ